MSYTNEEHAVLAALLALQGAPCDCGHTRSEHDGGPGFAEDWCQRCSCTRWFPADTTKPEEPRYPSYCRVTGHVFPCGCASCDVLTKPEQALQGHVLEVRSLSAEERTEVLDPLSNFFADESGWIGGVTKPEGPGT